MSQAPSMPVFVDALIGDTLHLSAEEFGAYCLLLFATWRNNGQPLVDDDEELARICRIQEAKWRKSTRAKLARFFDITDGAWRQKRLEREWEYVQKKADVSRRNGGRGGRPRKNPPGFPEKPSGFSAGSFQGAQTETTQPQPHTHRENPSQPALGVSEPGGCEPQAGQAGRLADFEILEEWVAEAEAEREAAGLPAVDLHEQARKLIDKWRDEPPRDPHAAWIGWAMKARAGRSNGAAECVPPSPQLRSDDDAQWSARLRGWVKSGFWMPNFGPRPDEPGCNAPAGLVEWANNERTKAKGEAA